MNKIFQKAFCALVFMVGMQSLDLRSQSTMSLQQVIREARQHTSLSTLEGMLQKENEAGISNINKKWLPQLQLQAQASYQSETSGIDLSFPGINIPRLSKDQYKIQADISQLVYDGGTTSALRQLQRQKTDLEKNVVSNEIDAIAETAIQVYYAVAEAKQRLKQTALTIQDLEAGIQRAKVAIEAGVMLASDGDHLRAELLKLTSFKEEIEATTRAGYEALALLTGKKIEKLQLEDALLPDTMLNSGAPFMVQFDLQKSMAQANGQLENTAIRPKLSLFAQTGYGKPGLNFLKNEFEPYYIAGLKLSWQLSAFYTYHNQRQLTDLAMAKSEARKTELSNRKMIKNRQLFNDWDRLNKSSGRDEEMVALREKILSTAEVQLANGNITASEYLVKLNDVAEARINQELNEIKKHKNIWLMQINMGWL
ncbi:MAG: TolC family protein [Saprospiraceae bacterium]|nr:TolC family protein [Saprospiraceae bacterium]